MRDSNALPVFASAGHNKNLLNMQRFTSSVVMNFVRSRSVLLLLIAVHVPFLFDYLRGLWQQTHYQFFPFAIGAFIWLFATRRTGDTERWTWPAWTLIAVDLCCLVVQPWIYSPWLAVVGLVMCLTAWCSANRDIGFQRRLTYLALLPVIVIRLPLLYDEQVIHWLQRMTTAMASKSLHRLGMLALQKGDKAGATTYLARVISVDPVSAEAALAKAVLDQLNR